MNLENSKTIVSTNWLAEHLGDPDLRILDASWYLPAMRRDGFEEYQVEHIPKALFFDLEEISDQNSAFPHMVPSAEKFASRMRFMGVGDGHQVVVYDGAGIFSAARVWWMFRLMGHFDIAVLDGGFPKWKLENRPTEEAVPFMSNRHFTVRYQNAMIRTKAQVLELSKLGGSEVIDARPPTRFKGEEPEPRAGLRSGHIPGSKNVFYNDLINKNGTMKKPEEIRAQFKDSGIDFAKPAITTCGSGITAAILNLGFSLIGKSDHSLYDGSWAEWGALPDIKN